MTKLEFKHNKNGVCVIINGKNLGNFENEKEAFYYLMLNNYIENFHVERSIHD